MSASGFPTDTYTPHGYLANPYAVAHSWSEGDGGCLRTSREYVGLGWLLPWTLRAKANVELLVGLRQCDLTILRRAEFAESGLHAPHHSSKLLVFRWQALGRTWEARYALVGQDELGLEVAWNSGPHPQPPGACHGAPPSGPPNGPDSERGGIDVTLLVVLRAETRIEGQIQVEGRTVTMPEPFGVFTLHLGEGADWQALDATDLLGAPTLTGANATQAAIAVSLDFSGESGTVRATLRQRSSQSPVGTDADAAKRVTAAVQAARTSDDRFWAGAARLEGDWPDSWRRGWLYDLETTRMCIYQPGGIFTDVWPAWMVQWPRAVIAEGTLDVVRLAYADPDLAKRAALSLFRDATAPNAPCVFQHGEPNMVAKDGSICGTSPAWCVPFYNLERLYWLTADHDWLAAIYPYLERYVKWWLAERTDTDVWAVYKCTWEAGEDDTPRLDPERRGDNVVSEFVRPVELQATMAMSAGVLARFARALGDDDEAARWRAVEADYAHRTRQLWDDGEGRFRDWDARTNQFLAPAGEPNYWNIDPCRFSALAFTPVLAGIATPEQMRRLHAEFEHYAGPPWNLWASWSYVVLEAAMLADARAFAGRVAGEIVGRVYAELDAHEIAAPHHPTPGVAREYWPLDLDIWESCEGYGWGANTSSLLLRQVFGFLERPAPERDTLHFRLWPALPEAFCHAGAAYRVANLPFRGLALTVSYEVTEGASDGNESALTISVETDLPTICRVTLADGAVVYASDGVEWSHQVAGLNRRAYDVTLLPRDW